MGEIPGASPIAAVVEEGHAVSVLLLCAALERSGRGWA